MKIKGYNVYLKGKWIDKVFWNEPSDIDEVRTSLINHDGYDARIEVEKE